MRRNPPASLLAVAALIMLPLTAFGQGQRLYKWVDEQGNVHYSDRVEGSVDDRRPERINAAGIRVGQQHSALPRTREEERRLEEARRRAHADAVLLATYRSEIELLRAHDESRANLENSIRTAEGNVRELQRALSVRAGNPQAPETLRIQRQLDEEQRRVEQLHSRRFELHERQNAEVLRYRELAVTNEDG